jgi:putative transposase
MKLTIKKIRWIICQKGKNESSGIMAKIQHITRRRIDQLWKQYRSTGEIPIIGEAGVYRKNKLQMRNPL